MRSMMVIVWLFVLFSFTWAQDKNEITPLETTKIKVERLAKQLNLSEDQVTKVNDIILKFETACQEYHNAANKDEDTYKNIHKDTEDQLKQVLSSEQYAKYSETKSNDNEVEKTGMGCAKSCSQKCGMNKPKEE